MDSAANSHRADVLRLRDFTDVADRILEQRDLGRAHHQALYFVHAGQDVTVGHLLDTLNITKQAWRVLRRLIDLGLVVQEVGAVDRRQRLLRLSGEGDALLQELIEAQRRLLREAFTEAGTERLEGFRRVMLAIMNEEDSARFNRRKRVR